jgi:Zn-dependent protease
MAWSGILGFGLFVALLFACVLLHELGHALTARRYGVSTKDIIISPIGGVARLYRMPQKPWAEFWVAIMGPAVNVGIALLLAIIISVTPLSFTPTGDISTLFSKVSNLVPLLMWINLGLVIFNLIPAFPMDGGRVFRSLLSLRWSPLQSTRIASYSGQTIAMGFIFYGVYQGEYILPFIGVFVFVTAALEYRHMKRVSAARSQKILEVTRPLTPLFLNDPIDRAVEIQIESAEQQLVVLDQTYNAVGYIDTRQISTKKFGGRIADLDIKEIDHVNYGDTIDEVAQKFEARKLPIFAVYTEDYLLGIVRKNDILP